MCTMVIVALPLLNRTVFIRMYKVMLDRVSFLELLRDQLLNVPLVVWRTSNLTSYSFVG